ncbi:MAG TPA: GYD domain-containing protein [Bryobacteraceae bacterium]|nr:GYD domain-containing protein [Bryobacteraceae bacterium]HUO32296.1 GYD domain-containing protein [Bryobacteraceae bacterium]
MPKFLIEASYTAEGLRGLAKDKASGRQTVVRDALAALGGKLEAAYFALGDSDVYVLCDCPDHVSAAALSLAVSATGLVRTKTIPLLTVEETDRALSMKTSYRAPGTAKAAKA